MNNLPDQEAKIPVDNNTIKRPITDPLSPLPLTRVIILTLIFKFPNITGYQLIQLVPKTLHPDISLKTGTVYSELRKLEERKKLLSEQEDTGRKHRRYTITNAGKQELVQLSQQIQNRKNFVIGPLLKLIAAL